MQSSISHIGRNTRDEHISFNLFRNIHIFDFLSNVCPCSNLPENVGVRVDIPTYRTAEIYTKQSLLMLLPNDVYVPQVPSLDLLSLSPSSSNYLSVCVYCQYMFILAAVLVYLLPHAIPLPGRQIAIVSVVYIWPNRSACQFHTRTRKRTRTHARTHTHTHTHNQ